MNATQVRQLVNRLAAAFPDPPMSDETRALYERFLIDLPYDQADVTIDDLIATTMKLPTISRVRRSMIEPGLEIPTADEAWATAQSRQQDVHELVRHVINLMGGSYNIRTSEDPELTRVRFVRAYEPLYRKAVDEALAQGLRAARMRAGRAA